MMGRFHIYEIMREIVLAAKKIMRCLYLLL